MACDIQKFCIPLVFVLTSYLFYSLVNVNAYFLACNLQNGESNFDKRQVKLNLLGLESSSRSFGLLKLGPKRPAEMVGVS